ncbi:unnamed protein product [Timema podura]|uniref:Uncharacterized protein n=1 Tax=Timema podura TaxID=61482 RepID=A0ABN7NJF6_TIMPD|nr:unnamed protein product [Timema podura]
MDPALLASETKPPTQTNPGYLHVGLFKDWIEDTMSEAMKTRNPLRHTKPNFQFPNYTRASSGCYMIRALWQAVNVGYFIYFINCECKRKEKDQRVVYFYLNECPGDGHSLLLSTRQHHSSLSHPSVKPFRECVDNEVISVGLFGHSDELLCGYLARVTRPIQNVVFYR